MIFDLQKFGDDGGSQTTTYEPSEKEKELQEIILANAKKNQPAIDYLRDAGMWALGNTVSQMYNEFNSPTLNNISFPSFAQWQEQKAAKTPTSVGNFMPLLGVDYKTIGKHGVISPTSQAMEDWLELNGYKQLGKDDFDKLGLDNPLRRAGYERALDSGRLNLWQRV